MNKRSSSKFSVGQFLRSRAGMATCLFLVIAVLVYVGVQKNKNTVDTVQTIAGLQGDSVIEEDTTVSAEATLSPKEFAGLSYPEGVVGKVDGVAFTEGAAVKKGDVLIRLDAGTTQDALTQAKQRLAGAKAKRLTAVASEKATTTSRIAAAQVAVLTAQQKLSQLQALPNPAEVASAQTAVKEAEAARAALASDATQLQKEAADAHMAEAKAALAVKQQGASSADLEVAQLGITGAQADLDSAKATTVDTSVLDTEVTAAEQEVSKLQDALAALELKSPIDGVLVQQAPKVGESVKGGVVLARVANLDSWVLKTTTVSASQVHRLVAGQKGTATIEALQDTPIEVSVTDVAQFGVKGSSSSQARFPVTITPVKNDPRFRWGMTATVDITVK